MSSKHEGTEWECVDCSKKYSNYSSYYVHMRNKHKQEARMRDASNYKIKFTEQQLNDLEDKIYVFLGELGDGNPENTQRNQQQHNITEDANRFAGQANYLTNFVVRTPYESQVDVSTEFPTIKGLKQWSQRIEKMKEQSLSLWDKLSIEREKWQFLDPIDTEIDPDDEFSLMDIPKLIKNMNKRDVKLEFPEFTVFTLWLSRVCKSDCWKQICQLIAYCCCEFYDYLNEHEQQKTVVNWMNYIGTRGVENVSNYEFVNNNVNISSTNWEKLLQFYYKWVEYFGVLPKKEKEVVDKVEKIEKVEQMEKV